MAVHNTPDRRAVLLSGLAGLALPILGAAAPRVSSRSQDAEGSVQGAVPGAMPGAMPAIPPAHTDAWRAQVVLLRHAEKQPGDDPELTEAGRAAARGLAALLSSAQVTYLEHSPFRRTAQTLEPLAEATGLEPLIFDPADSDALRERLFALPDGSLSVIAGHSNTIPQAVVALGGEIGDLDARGFIHDEVYDRLFVVSLCRLGEGQVIATTLELRLP